VGGLCQEAVGGPQAVLTYLSRYTHRVAISNRRLISADEASVTFKWKDYRIEGPDRYKTMTLPTGEFIRRFLTARTAQGLHRIRHYGLFANSNRAAHRTGARVARLPSRSKQAETSTTAAATKPACCASVPLLRRPDDHHETFARGRHRNTAGARYRTRSASTPHDAVTTDPQPSDIRRFRWLSASTAPLTPRQ